MVAFYWTKEAVLRFKIPARKSECASQNNCPEHSVVNGTRQERKMSSHIMRGKGFLSKQLAFGHSIENRQ